jgi:hypothetical protein
VLAGYSRPLVRVADYLALLERLTYDGRSRARRRRTEHALAVPEGAGATKPPGRSPSDEGSMSQAEDPIEEA